MKKLLIAGLLLISSGFSLFTMDQQQPACKKRKITPIPVYPQAHFDLTIKLVMSDLMLKNEGTIWAALPKVRSLDVMRLWTQRNRTPEIKKSAQQYLQSCDSQNSNSIITSYQELLSAPDKTPVVQDILIVDKKALSKKDNSLTQQALKLVAKAGVRAKVHIDEPIHHKFMLFLGKNDHKKRLLITGSWDTDWQQSYGHDMFIIDDPYLIDKYIQRHQALQSHSVDYPQANKN